MPGERCSNCIAFGSECTHNIASWKTKGADSTKEPDNTEISSLISEIVSAPGVYIPPPNPLASRKLIIRLATYAKFLEIQLSSSQPGRTTQTSEQVNEPSSSKSSPQWDESDDDEEVDLVSDSVQQLSLYPTTERCYGKTSYMSLVQTVWHVLKQETIGGDEVLDMAINNTKRHEFWSDISPKFTPNSGFTQTFHSPEFQTIALLSELYFNNVSNFVAPFMHRPSFEKAVTSNLHCRDPWFAALVLSVCACGSRFSDDPYMLAYGWQCLNQVQSFLTPFTEGTCCLYELQVYCNCVWFLQSPSTLRRALLLLSHAIRIAQDVGANRRRWYIDNNRTPVENESWKRTFWALMLMDDNMSEYLGRPRLMRISDYDVALPIECDDEYWEHPDPKYAFKQPADKPARVSLYIETLKLARIFIQSEFNFIHAPQQVSVAAWRKEVLDKFDLLLKAWFENLPTHLQWSADRGDRLFAEQATILHVLYCWVQIQKHRRFIYIPETGKSLSASSISSLSICVDAARSCAHILDIQTQKGFIPPTYIQTAVLYAATILFLKAWLGKSFKMETNMSDTDDVYKCMTILRRCEHRWAQAGQLCDIIQALLSTTSLGQTPLLEYCQRDDLHSMPGNQPLISTFAGWSSDSSHLNWNFDGLDQLSFQVYDSDFIGGQTYT